jgi:hypothetical protein
MEDPFDELKREVQSQLSSGHHKTTLSQDLSDLQHTIDVARQNPARFGLTSLLLDERQAFIDRAKQSISQSTSTRSSNPFDRPSSSKDPFADSNASFMEAEGQQQSLLFKAQDRQVLIHLLDFQLDGVYDTVVNLKNVAHIMGNELEEQEGMMHEIDEMVDSVSGRLEHGVKKLNQFIKVSKREG